LEVLTTVPLAHAEGKQMSTFSKKTLEFLASEAGPTATEYAVLLAVISLTVLGAMAAFGQRVDSIYAAIDGAAGGV